MVDTLSPPPQIDESATGPSGGEQRLRRPVLRTHRGLPARRAIAGGVLVAAAALGLFTAFLRADSAGRDQLVVARRAIPAGTRLSASDLRLVPMHVPCPKRGHAFRSLDGFVGRLCVGPIGD